MQFFCSYCFRNEFITIKCKHSIVRHGKICFKAMNSMKRENRERKKCNGYLFLGAIQSVAFTLCLCLCVLVWIIRCKESGVPAKFNVFIFLLLVVVVFFSFLFFFFLAVSPLCYSIIYYDNAVPICTQMVRPRNNIVGVASTKKLPLSIVMLMIISTFN